MGEAWHGGCETCGAREVAGEDLLCRVDNYIDGNKSVENDDARTMWGVWRG